LPSGASCAAPWLQDFASGEPFRSNPVSTLLENALTLLAVPAKTDILGGKHGLVPKIWEMGLRNRSRVNSGDFPSIALGRKRFVIFVLRTISS